MAGPSSAPPLIIDLGNHSLRMGFAGSSEPQMLYPNAVSTITEDHLELLGHRESVEKQADETIKKFERNRSEHLVSVAGLDAAQLSAMMKKKRTRDEERRARTWHRAFGEFPVDPLKKVDDVNLQPIIYPVEHDKRLSYQLDYDRLACAGDSMWGIDSTAIPDLIFTEPIPGQSSLKKSLMEIAFETWLAPSCLSAPSQIYQAAGAATPTSLVIDLGHTHITSCYVVDGYIHPDTVSTSSLSINKFDQSMIKKILDGNKDMVKPLTSFFSNDGIPIKPVDIELGNVGFGSHPMPFTTNCVLDWQYRLLAQIIRESFSDDDLTAANMNTFVLPDGTPLKTDGTMYSSLSAYLCGTNPLPKQFRSKYMDSTDNGDQKKDKRDNDDYATLIDTLTVTADAILQLHKTKTVVKKKSKSGEKSGGLPSVPLPERVTLSGGGTLAHGFDDTLISLLHGQENIPRSWTDIGIHGENAINYSYKTNQTSASLWEEVQKNPTCTKAILSALRIPTPDETLTKSIDPPVHIVTGNEAKGRVYLSYRGASIIGSVGSFSNLTMTLEEYMEIGPDRAILKMPI